MTPRGARKMNRCDYAGARSICQGRRCPCSLKRWPACRSRVRWTLTILGTGPCTPKWKRHAQRLQIVEYCDWQGHLSRDEALRIVHASHLFVTTSLKDLTSTVIVEAMAHGVPILCPDHCGFSDAIDETCGIKLPVRNLKKFIEALAHAITTLHDDEALRRRLAQGALARVHKFSWEEKASSMAEIYRRKIRYARERATSACTESRTRLASVAQINDASAYCRDARSQRHAVSSASDC